MVQRRIQILAVAVALTALGWAVFREHLVAAFVTFGSAGVIACLALFQRDDPDSTALIKKRLKLLAADARAASNSSEFLTDYHARLSAMHNVMESRYGIAFAFWSKDAATLASYIDDVIRQLSGR